MLKRMQQNHNVGVTWVKADKTLLWFHGHTLLGPEFGITIHSLGCPLLPSSFTLLVVGGVPGQLVGPNRSIPP